MKDSTWMKMAEAAAEDSKCVSLKVGTVLVKDGHIISTGINGTPKGYINCCDKFTERSPEHSAWSEKFEVHSEMNALLYCPVDTRGSHAYVTHAPCFNCAKHLVAAGVKSIVYKERYYRQPDKDFNEVVDFCNHMKVEYSKL